MKNTEVLDDGSISTIDGYANVSPNGDASFEVVFGWFLMALDFLFGWIAFVPNYNVIATDYVNYAVVYSCSPILFGIMHAELLWVLGR